MCIVPVSLLVQGYLDYDLLEVTICPRILYRPKRRHGELAHELVVDYVIPQAGAKGGLPVRSQERDNTKRPLWPFNAKGLCCVFMSYWEPSYGYYMKDTVLNGCASPSQCLLSGMACLRLDL
jgi:hypothetical protein